MSDDEKVLTEKWAALREEIIKYMGASSRYHEDAKLFKLIMEYGDAQAAKENRAVKNWIIKKLS